MTGEEKTKCDEEISIMKELNHPNVIQLIVQVINLSFIGKLSESKK